MNTIAPLSVVFLFSTLLNITYANEPGIPKEMSYPEGIVLGCTEAAVTAILGEPESIIELGTQKTIQYRLGEVVFEKDRLIRAKFVSEEERGRAEADKQAFHQEALARKEKLRAENLEHTTKIRDQKLQDQDFLLDTPENQLRFWKNLKRQCPDLDLSLQIQKAVQNLKEFQKLKIAHRIRMLENKAAELEAKANEAEKKALAAEKKVIQAEARLERIKRETSRFPIINPVVYPRSTGIYFGPNGRQLITYDPVSAIWRPAQIRPTLQINIR